MATQQSFRSRLRPNVQRLTLVNTILCDRSDLFQGPRRGRDWWGYSPTTFLLGFITRAPVDVEKNFPKLLDFALEGGQLFSTNSLELCSSYGIKSRMFACPNNYNRQCACKDNRM